MIDTLRFTIHIDDPVIVQGIIGKLANTEDVTDRNDGATKITGFFHNFHVTSERDTISFSGSLSKYFYNSNIYDLTRSEIREACSKLSGELGVDISSAKILRLDIGRCIELDHPVSEYLMALSRITVYKRLETEDETVEYRSKSNEKSFVFYNKIKELQDKDKDKKNTIPEEFINKNILRYECRFLSKVKNNLKSKDPIMFSDLYNREFYKYLVTLWVDRYNSITKRRIFMLDSLSYENLTPDKLKTYLSAFALNQIGYNNIIEQLDSNRNIIGINNFSRFREMLNRLSNDNRFFINDKHIEELDQKVNNTINEL